MLHHHHHLLHSLPLPSQLHLLTPPTPLPQGPLPLSRRSLSAAVLLPLLPTFPSAAAEPEPEPPSGSACPPAASEQTTRTAFLDISIDGVPAGRITIGLFGGAGAARFASLVSGAAGISYRRKEFVKIMPGYVQHAGVRSYGADAELARWSGMEPSATGSGGLVAEWVASAGDRCSAKCVAGSVGMVVRNPAKPPPKVKVVARNGRLEVEEEEVGVDPNGTEFVIVSRDSPELDESVLVVGRVVDGMEVVERMEEVKTVQENSSSPYFRVAKLIGDKRAVVAERGFNRPYSKVVVTNCGLLD